MAIKNPRVVIIMPTYKEAENIKKMIPALFEEEFPKIKNADMHLLVVNDLIPDTKKDDGTGDIVRKQAKKYRNIHLVEHVKEGLGAAYVRGMKYAMKELNADAVMEMDADFQHPPRFIKSMVDAYIGGADYVIGSRYIKGGSVPKEWELSRKAMSYFGNLFIRIVWLNFKIHDMTTGFRLTKVKGVLNKIDLDNIREPSRFAYKVDLLYKSIKNAKNIVEVPLEFAPRKEELSKFNISEMITTFKLAFILGIIDKKRFIKFGTVGFVGYLVNASFLYLFTRAGLPVWLRWALSTEMAIMSNFTLNNLWTFRTEKITGIGHLLSKFLQFNMTSLGALGIQTVAGTIGTGILGEQYQQILLPFIIVFLVLPYNYFMYNAVIWKTWKMPKLLKLQVKKT